MAMQRSNNPNTNFEKYRPVPRPKVPVEDDEIRVSVVGRMSRYVIYAASLLTEKNMKRIVIKATGNAVASAITLAEVLKRRFADLHQQSIIGMTQSIDTYEPVEEGLDPVTYERNVPFIEIIIALDPSLVNVQAEGYQSPIDQTMVRPYVAENRNVSTEGGFRRGSFRGFDREGQRRPRGARGYQSRQESVPESNNNGRNFGPRVPRRGGSGRFRGNGRRMPAVQNNMAAAPAPSNGSTR